MEHDFYTAKTRYRTQLYQLVVTHSIYTNAKLIFRQTQHLESEQFPQLINRGQTGSRTL